MKIPLLLLFAVVASAVEEVQVCVAIDKTILQDQQFFGWQIDKRVTISGDTGTITCGIGESAVSSEIIGAKEVAQELVDFVKRVRQESLVVPREDLANYTRLQVNIIMPGYREVGGLIFIKNDTEIPEVFRLVEVRAAVAAK